MHLTKLVIKNFRKLTYAELSFQVGLNVLVGGNNVGKMNRPGFRGGSTS